MDAVKGRCTRSPCRYFHPPLHLQAQIKAAQSRAVIAIFTKNINKTSLILCSFLLCLTTFSRFLHWKMSSPKTELKIFRLEASELGLSNFSMVLYLIIITLSISPFFPLLLYITSTCINRTSKLWFSFNANLQF